MRRLLKEIEYQGKWFEYEEVSGLQSGLNTFLNLAYEKPLLTVYKEKSEHTFLWLEEAIKYRKRANILLYMLYKIKEFLLNDVYRRLRSKS